MPEYNHSRQIALATALSLGVALATAAIGVVVLAGLERIDWIGASAQARYKSSLSGLMLAVLCGTAYFCRRVDSTARSVLFANWKAERRWYAYAVVGAIVVRLVAQLMPQPHSDPLGNPDSVDAFFSQAGCGLSATALAFVYIAFFIPLIEDLLFRRLVFASLARRPKLAFVLSVVVFSALHPPEVRGLAVVTGDLLPRIYATDRRTDSGTAVLLTRCLRANSSGVS